MRGMPSITCERTRALVSGALDGCLHELERRLLDAHLERCAECRSFAGQVEWFTLAMRSAPLEPAPPVVLPRLRRRIQLRSVASVAAAAVVIVAAGNLALTVPSQHQQTQRSAVRISPLESESLQRIIRSGPISGRLPNSPAAAEDRARVDLGAVKPVLLPANP